MKYWLERHILVVNWFRKDYSFGRIFKLFNRKDTKNAKKDGWAWKVIKFNVLKLQKIKDDKTKS